MPKNLPNILAAGKTAAVAGRFSLRRWPYFGSLALLAYMPFHVFLAQSLSLLTGGLDAWKIAKDVAVALLTLLTIGLVWRARRGSKAFGWLVGFTVAYGLLHLLLWAFHSDIYKTSALLGIIYNIRLFCFVIIGYGAALLEGLDRQKIKFLLKFVLAISSLVALLGILQYFLPRDILTHVGYSLDRGVRPAFFIDDKPDLPRVMSTLRDPNSLGAYLIVPITALAGLALQSKTLRRRLQLAGLLALHGAALFLTFSRSAWLTTVVAVALLLWWRFHAVLLAALRRFWLIGAVLLALVGGGLFAERHTYFVKGFITHSTGKPRARYDSNGFHWYFVHQGLDGIEQSPLGHGPGTAGLVSIQNPKGGLLTENYYVQIGYEIGVIGLAAFVAANMVLYGWLRRRRTMLLGSVLLASFWGYVVMNMLLHTWSNEAVAGQWWLLAGAMIAATHQATKVKARD